MKMLKVCLLLAAVAMFVAPAVASDVSVFLGQKDFAEDEIDTDIEYGVGLALDFDWPVMLTVDILQAEGDVDAYLYDRGSLYEFEAETTELHVGVRYPFLTDGKIQPYIGGGAAYVQTDISAELNLTRGSPGFSDDDSDVGFFAGAGVLFRVAEQFNIGIDARWSDADAEINPGFGRGFSTIEADAGGVHYGVTFGYHW